MSSGEIIVLNSTYRIAKSGQFPDMTGANPWLEYIAKESGLSHSSLVEIYEEDLIKKHLLSRRVHNDQSGVSVKPHFRLTSLGLELCDYIDNYDNR